jgi:hypothetical protein
LLNVSDVLQGTVQKVVSVGNMWKLIFVDTIDKMTDVSIDWAATAPRKRKVHNSAISPSPYPEPERTKVTIRHTCAWDFSWPLQYHIVN